MSIRFDDVERCSLCFAVPRLSPDPFDRASLLEEIEKLVAASNNASSDRMKVREMGRK